MLELVRKLFTEYSVYLVGGIVGLLVLMRLLLPLYGWRSRVGRAILWCWHEDARRGEITESTYRTTLQIMNGELAILAVLLGLVRPAVVQACYIPSGSMMPTLVGDAERQDRVLVDKYIYKLRAPRRGEIVVFKPPVEAQRGNPNPNEDLIKRIIGLPGDVVQIRDGFVWINGHVLSEPYVMPGARTLNPQEQLSFLPPPPIDFSRPRRVPPGHYLMLGDNRENSRDGRYFGYVPADHLRGRAMLRIWPPTALSVLETAPDVVPVVPLTAP